MGCFYWTCHSLCLKLESFARLPTFVLPRRFLVAVYQNRNKPQLQSHNQHIHHNLWDHCCELWVGCRERNTVATFSKSPLDPACAAFSIDIHTDLQPPPWVPPASPQWHAHHPEVGEGCAGWCSGTSPCHCMWYCGCKWMLSAHCGLVCHATPGGYWTFCGGSQHWDGHSGKSERIKEINHKCFCN